MYSGSQNFDGLPGQLSVFSEWPQIHTYGETHTLYKSRNYGLHDDHINDTVVYRYRMQTQHIFRNAESNRKLFCVETTLKQRCQCTKTFFGKKRVYFDLGSEGEIELLQHDQCHFTIAIE